MIKVPFSPPDITEAEINAVAEVMRSGWITTGPETKTFEKEIADAGIDTEVVSPKLLPSYTKDGKKF